MAEHKRRQFEEHLSIFVHAMKVTCDQNSFVINTFFYVVQKKVSHSGLKQHEGE